MSEVTLHMMGAGPGFRKTTRLCGTRGFEVWDCVRVAASMALASRFQASEFTVEKIHMVFSRTRLTRYEYDGPAVGSYWGTSLTRNGLPLGPNNRTMPRALLWP